VHRPYYGPPVGFGVRIGPFSIEYFNMRKLLLASAIAFVATSAHAEETAATYTQIENEIGCQSKATDAKKEVIFNTKYKARWVTWTGKVHDVKGNTLWLNTLGSSSIGSDFDVDMTPGTDLLQFDKGDQVTVRFQIKDYMGCILPLRGSNGTIVRG
jgi:hypothetical protein